MNQKTNMNIHYQNLLDDRRIFEDIRKDQKHMECWPCVACEQKLQDFLKQRRLIEWKKEVERLEDEITNECKNAEVSEYYSGWRACLEKKIALYKEAIALTEAEK